MFLSLKIIRYLVAGWIIASIVISAIVISSASPGPGQDPLAYYRSIFLMIGIICLSIAITGYPALYLLMRYAAPTVAVIVILFLVNVFAATVGNAICYLFSDFLFVEGFYSSVTDHLADVMIFLIPVFAVAMVILTLKTGKNRVLDELRRLKHKMTGDVNQNSVSIKLEEGHCLINFDDIVYVSAHGKKTIFHTMEKEYTAMLLLKDVEKRLPGDMFFRIHRQHIINIKFLREIRYYEGGRYMVYLNDSDESILPVSRNISPRLKERIGI